MGEGEWDGGTRKGIEAERHTWKCQVGEDGSTYEGTFFLARSHHYTYGLRVHPCSENSLMLEVSGQVGEKGEGGLHPREQWDIYVMHRLTPTLVHIHTYLLPSPPKRTSTHTHANTHITVYAQSSFAW